jgi:hypothetical protein
MISPTDDMITCCHVIRISNLPFSTIVLTTHIFTQQTQQQKLVVITFMYILSITSSVILYKGITLFICQVMKIGAYTSLCVSGYLMGVQATELSADIRHEFEQWALRQHKSYPDNSNKEKALLTWISNTKLVDAINKANMTWTATVENQFGDLTPAEFKETFLMRTISTEDLTADMTRKQPKMTAGVKRNPKSPRKSGVGVDETSFDWRDHGAVTGVHDQGSVGTCW